MRRPSLASVVFAGVCGLLILSGPMPTPYVVAVVVLLALLIAATEHPS